MSEPLTIYECPLCRWIEGEDAEGCYCTACGRTWLVPVRVFRADDVKPLWDALFHGHPDGGPGYIEQAALDAFPAPEEWKR